MAVPFTNTDSGNFNKERENECPEDIRVQGLKNTYKN